ncbi:MAG: site-specific integrase, partial [Burkholderiaceae bacterium]
RSEASFEPWLTRLRAHLREERYSHWATWNYVTAARRFLRALERRGQALESVSAADVERYLDGLKRQRDRRALPAPWRRQHQAAIHMLLRLVRGKWPPEIAPTTADEIAIHEVVRDYDAWIEELRGLSASTREHARTEAHALLRWLHDHGKSVATLGVADLDAYLAWRGSPMRRNSKATMISTLRGVLRYLHGSGRMPVDLVDAIEGPPIYALEGIPSTIRREDIERATKAARCDRSPLGRRDYAILMLLSTYGLRSGEITGLRLSDIDWRHERLRIRHAKTGACSELPLLRGPADALLDYLQHARPATTFREVFLRALAPYRPLCGGGALHCMLGRRLRAVGVVLSGKRGVHLLRHSRAVSLLRGGVPVKVIGDVLGHRSERSTAAYLKLATEDLRAVALDLPAGVSR